MTGFATFVNIDPDGDLIVELIHNDGHLIGLRVSSKALSLVSPVFRAMFQSGFMESILYRQTGATDTLIIPFLDDDAEAFELFSRAAHSSKDLPETIPSHVLVQFAILCDKYDSVQQLSPYARYWCENAKVLPESVNLYLLVAYVMDLPSVFFALSNFVLKHHVGPYIELPGFSDHDLVRRNVMGTLDQTII